MAVLLAAVIIPGTTISLPTMLLVKSLRFLGFSSLKIYTCQFGMGSPG